MDLPGSSSRDQPSSEERSDANAVNAGTSSLPNGSNSDGVAENGERGDEDAENGGRVDEDALPVPLERVERLTGGVDEDDDRQLEFPWDEDARKARSVPKPIRFQDTVVSVECHPSENLVACAHIDGVVSINRFCLPQPLEEGEKAREEEDEVDSGDKRGCHGEEVFSYLDYEEPCRAVRFHQDGAKLISASALKDLTILDVESEEVERRIDDAHDEPVYAIASLAPSLIASGDDAGVVKLWDPRQPQSICRFKENSDFISALGPGDGDVTSTRRLLATSGDGTLTSFNLRQRKVELRSENFDSELLSMAPIRNRSKLVTGDGHGICGIFHWDEWGYYADKFPVTEGNSLDAAVAISDNVVAVAGVSGIIYAVHFDPNRLLGRIGNHGGDDGTGSPAPIDSLSLSHEGDVLVSCGHDNRVRFWSVAHLQQIDVNKLPRRGNSQKMARRQLDPEKRGFFRDLAGYDRKEEEEEAGSDSDSDSDSDTDSDSEGKTEDKEERLDDIEEEEENDDDANDNENDDKNDDNKNDSSDSDSPPPKKKLK